MITKKLTVFMGTVVIAGCGTVAEVSRDIDDDMERTRDAVKTPFQIQSRSRVVEMRGTFIPVTPMSSLSGGQWLRQKMVSLDIKNPTPLSAIVSKFAEQGLNIATDLPLNSYSYVGKVNRTDAETALKVVLGSVGLDYHIEDKNQFIVIRPVSSRTWSLNIGNRRSTYSSGTDSENSSDSSNTGNSGSQSNNNSSAFGSSAFSFNQGQGSGLSGSNSQFTNTGSSGTNTSNGIGNQNTGTYASDDFWNSLARELDARLTITTSQHSLSNVASQSPVPISATGQTSGHLVPPIQNAAVALLSGPGTERYTGKKIGSYSLNPETGAITVQAPRWVLSELDSYFKGVQEMYNTNISFSGEVVLVTTNRGDSEGFDLTAFAQWAGGKYGAVISNNALGGVTVSMPEGGGLPSVTSGAQAIAGPIIGMQYRGSNALDIFNAYLSEIGKVSVIQRPMLTTTSGVPGVFRKKHVDYYNTVSQQAAPGGTGSAATATQNVIVPVETGTDLRINPRVDVATGLIRAQIKLDQIIRSGTRIVPQTITFGNNVQSVNTQIPLTTRQDIQGEVLLKDGDLIIVGGQVEDNLTVDESGLPGGKSGPMGGLFGVKESNRGKQTYYFALRVTVNKRQ